MTKYRKILSLIIAMISIFIFTGCSCNSDENYISAEMNSGVLQGTTHIVSADATSYKIVDNGATDYSIVVKADKQAYYSEAISELRELFEQSTSLKLNVINDASVSYNDNAKYFSIGDTDLVASAGISVDYSLLGSQGYHIETKGKSIFICGEKRGVVYGVYELMYRLAGFETLSNKVTYIETGIKDLFLPNFNITEVPDILYRVPISGNLIYNSDAAHRMRMIKMEEEIMAEGGAHNVLRYIVPQTESSLNNHPDWFSNDKTQLCYTAHGNEEEYAAMVAEAVANVKGIVERYPDQNTIGITQMDAETWCECETCQALEDKYGTNAASQIRFINDVSDIINDWTKEELGGRELQFLIFAYHKTEKAPAVKQDGEWKAIDDSVILNDNVAIWIAPLYEDYTISVNHQNSFNLRNMMESWHACTKTYYVWAYNVYFDNYLIPYDSYSAMQDLIKYFVKHNTKFLWAQGNYNTHENTGYDDLKNYLFSKLMWNCNLDINELITNFFKKVYREAADIMENTYWSWRVLSQQQKEDGKSGSIYMSPNKEKFWPKRYLNVQLEMMNNAIQAIEKYKESDLSLYKSIYNSILCETINPRYLLIEHYSNTFSKQDLAVFKSGFRLDVDRLGFDMLAEHVSLSGYAE